MRKMTKTAVTLAAMSAMTVATASMAFAAEKQEPNISSIAREEEAVNTSAVGEWSGDDVKGWKFTKEDGTKLKDQWAEIDGVWYYFKGETMVQDRFLTLDNKGYFFDKHGRLATGWQKINSEMDAYSDIDIAEKLNDYYTNNSVLLDNKYEYGYHDYVWCHFDESGVAKENEWFQSPESGLWYYFDGNVMVRSSYAYPINPDNYDAAESSQNRYYGFDVDGAMLVGWNYKEVPTTWNNPTADDKGRIWYYYNSNGQMQKEGWKKIGSDWYLFASRNADDAVGDGVGGKMVTEGYPLIVNSYVKSYPNGGNSPEHFYVDGNGKLVSGIKTIKNAYKVLFYQDRASKTVNVDYEYIMTPTDKNITINFADGGYAAKEDIVSNRYYAMSNANVIAASVGTSNDKDIVRYNSSVYIDKNLNGFGRLTTGGYSLGTTNDGSDRWKFTDSGSQRVNSGTITYIYDPASTVANPKKAGNPAVTAVVGNDGKITYTLEKTTNSEKAIKNVKDTITTYNTAVNDYVNAAEEWDEAVASPDVEPITYAVSGYAGKWTAVTPLAVTGSAARINRAAVSDGVDNILEVEASAIKAVEDIQEMINNNNNSALDAVYREQLKQAQEWLKVVVDARKAVVEGLSAQINKNVAALYQAADKALDDAQNNLDAALARIKALDIAHIDAVDKNSFEVVGELVKNALIYYKSGLYLADNNGDLMTNKALLIADNANIAQGSSTYANAYILFGSDGKAVNDYAGTMKTIVIGGVSYWSTNETVTYYVRKYDADGSYVGDGEKVVATVFVSNREVDGRR